LSQDNSQRGLVAIIGSARIDETDARWSDAFKLGEALAHNGFSIMTGGYGGLMAAVAKGAFKNGGPTIGLPMKPWTHLTPDSSHLELRWSEDYFERLNHLLSADYLIVLDGGIGTLSEMSLAWAIAQTEIKHSKIVVMGQGIKKLLEEFMNSLVISNEDMNIIEYVDSISEVIAHLNTNEENNDEVGKAIG
jgi:uncharacterized protein (TIGR00730 family)